MYDGCRMEVAGVKTARGKRGACQPPTRPARADESVAGGGNVKVGVHDPHTAVGE